MKLSSNGAHVANYLGLRIMSSIVILLALMFSRTVLADDISEDAYVGAWQLVSFVNTVVDTSEMVPVLGEHPRGYLALMRTGRGYLVITADNRKVPTTEEDRAEAFSTMIAYSGIYTVRANVLKIKIDVTGNEAINGTEQTRFLSVKGGELYLTTAPFHEPSLDKEVVGTMIFKREN